MSDTSNIAQLCWKHQCSPCSTLQTMEKAVQFLNNIGRIDLSALIQLSRFQLIQVEIWNDYAPTTIQVTSAPVFTEALKGLPKWDQDRIGEAIASTYPGEPIRTDLIQFVSDETIEIQESEALYPEIIVQRNQMISVATGGLRIQDVNDYYRARYRRISAALKNLGLEHANPHEDLWDWYRKWKADFPSYAERREYVNEIYKSILERLSAAPIPIVIPREPTGWERVDRALEKAQVLLPSAKHEEDYQSIGLLCREILISLGQAVYDPTHHPTTNGVKPSETDAERMIEAFIVKEASGESNDYVRKHAKAALKLAVHLQHKRTAHFRVTALCLEATSSLVNIVAILSGRRDPTI